MYLYTKYKYKMSDIEPVACNGWYLSCNPQTGEISINIPEARQEINSLFVRYNDEPDVWLKMTSSNAYILDWQTNARTLYLAAKDRGEKVASIPDDILDYVFLPLEKTRNIMNKLCESKPRVTPL